MQRGQKEQGFTLIELLLVVVIIGILLAVIVPRAWRANVDAKYSNVRQNCTELASVGVQWAENQLNGQDSEESTAQLADYLAYIASPKNMAGEGVAANIWIADDSVEANGWMEATEEMDAYVATRYVGGNRREPPSGPAMEMMPVDKRARNPFNGMDVFATQNDPVEAGEPIPGAIASGFAEDDELGGGEDGTQWYYYALRFQGTDNTDNKIAADNNVFHADMNSIGGVGDDEQLNGLRAGVFMARAQRVD